MKSDSSVPGENTLADTAASKSESFYKLTSSEAKHLYDLGVFSAQAYVLMIIRSHGAVGWKWTFKVKDFCKEWGIPKRTFYLAISKLKSLDLIHWEAKDTITVWYGSDIAQDATNNTASVQKESSLVSKQKHVKNVEARSSCTLQEAIGINAVQDVAPRVQDVAPRVQDVAPRVQDVAPRVQDVAQQMAGTLTSTETAEASDSSQSYLEFKKTLSDSQRENFLDFGKKKANLLPRPPELPLKWIEVNWEELRSQWEQTKEGSAAITELTDWTQHADWETWLEEMRRGTPRFVALGTCFDRKTRQAIVDWANERRLIWGLES